MVAAVRGRAGGAGTAQVVIGAGYGDEGKGALTDAFAAELSGGGGTGTVVRFNGGAQAGHTVELADGRRHVFAHVGSGAFRGWRTALSRFFVCHPALFLREWDALARLGVRPGVAVDPRCPVTTPYDMLVNQWAEDARGTARHGSVGVGFGETVGRCEDPAYALHAAGLLDGAALRARLLTVRDAWAPQRLAALGVPPPRGEAAALLRSDALLERFVEDCAAFLARVELRAPELRGPVVFEGAQGLLLDQARGAFPHVTRSHTGLRNVLALAGEAGIAELDVHYATRAYATRHGAGPLPHAWAEPRPGVVDRTNRTHAYQGTPRQAWLDLGVLAGAVSADLSDAGSDAGGDAGRAGIRVRHGLTVTHLDQAGPDWAWFDGARLRAGSGEACAEAAAEAVGAGWLRLAWGPTAEAYDGVISTALRRTHGSPLKIAAQMHGPFRFMPYSPVYG